MDYLKDYARNLFKGKSIISIVIVDLSYNILMHNDRLKIMIGDNSISKGDSFSKFEDFFGEEVNEAIKQAFSGEIVEIEHNYLKDNRFFESIIRPLRDDKDILYAIVITTKEITERIHHLITLEYNERELKSLYDNAPLGYQSLDKNGRFLYVNDALSNMLEYSKEELIGQWFGDFLVIEGSNTFKQNFPKFKEKGETRIDIKMLTKSGNAITVMFDGKIAYNDDGSFKQTHCILKNITEDSKKQKRTDELVIANEELAFQNDVKEMRAYELGIANKELIFQKEKMKELADELIIANKELARRNTQNLDDLEKVENIFENSIKNAPVPIMIHADDGTVLNVSKTAIKLTHYTKADIPTIYDWTEKAFGKNKTEVIDFLRSLYVSPETQHEGEFEVTTKDGRKLIWDFNSGVIGTLPDGRAVAMSVATDVTERHAREQEKIVLIDKIRNTETLLKASLESPKDMIILSMDKEYHYNYFNEGHKEIMLAIYGTKIKIGDNALDQITIKKDRIYAKKHYDRALTGESYSSIDIQGENEKTYYESHYYPIYDTDNVVIGASVFARDITERIVREEENRTLNDKVKSTEILLKASLESPKGIIILSLDTEYKYMFFNQTHRISMKVGYGADIKEGKCIFDFMTSKDDIIRVKKNYDKALLGETHTTIEQFGVDEVNYYENVFSPIKNDLQEIIGVSSFARDITDRVAKEKEISYLSYHDLLTKLYNRRFFEEQLKRLDNPRNLPLSVIMGDVNGLKLTNDAFGHKAGDELLKMIGDIILTSIRGNDIAARWGGDEFTILLPNSGADAAEVLINRIQKKIKKASFEYGKISISFGFDAKIVKEEDINDVFTSAEVFMYQNKLSEIDSARGQTINTIMTALFEKSFEVKEHSMRVSELSAALAKKMGLSKANANDIKIMGMIHDIGKIVIDLQILDKPSKLTDEERKIIQQHSFSGSRMLNSSHEYARLAAGVLHHHERIDGKGYPNGIIGDQIPIESKIIAIADAFDAMTAERPYRLTPLSTEEAIAELQKHSGTQFDKDIVDVFVNMVL